MEKDLRQAVTPAKKAVLAEKSMAKWSKEV